MTAVKQYGHLIMRGGQERCSRRSPRRMGALNQFATVVIAPGRMVGRQNESGSSTVRIGQRVSFIATLGLTICAHPRQCTRGLLSYYLSGCARDYFRLGRDNDLEGTLCPISSALSDIASAPPQVERDCDANDLLHFVSGVCFECADGFRWLSAICDHSSKNPHASGEILAE